MAHKDILCLAFSKRDGGHCFGGIDLEAQTWVRPVSSKGSGELPYHECLIRKPDGTFAEPSLLDVLRIDLQKPQPRPAQPENWLMGESEWEFVGRKQFADLAPWIHRNDDPELFRNYSKSLSVDEVVRRNPSYSLTLIRPENLAWRTELNQYGKKRARGIFSICGQSYDLPLTDEAYQRNLVSLPLHASLVHDFSTPILLTLSLGEAWHGFHYKLIAGVITG
jgi:hypothetical protein